MARATGAGLQARRASGGRRQGRRRGHVSSDSLGGNASTAALLGAVQGRQILVGAVVLPVQQLVKGNHGRAEFTTGLQFCVAVQARQQALGGLGRNDGRRLFLGRGWGLGARRHHGPGAPGQPHRDITVLGTQQRFQFAALLFLGGPDLFRSGASGCGLGHRWLRLNVGRLRRGCLVGCQWTRRRRGVHGRWRGLNRFRLIRLNGGR
ncbi:hypothetical protein C8263_13765 [Deinococcus arcticus]|uniref:Uncharacterized protein n=1 Tax=Deinococcus arcticus TaxID=2136176 RepID=A0A2T3W5L4_9DEIO|nr:hypothetical protein C8263_13765 [Deinococcus arcticus]